MVSIIKATGEKEEFSENKLRQSILRAGVAKETVDEAISHIKDKLYENIPTSEIYKHIIEFLDTPKTPFAKARYSLKKALMDLGPTGYPFEDYLAKLLSQEGYTTTVRNIVLGKCVSHEIDIIATKGNEKIMVEAKFHNSVGIKTDVQVALYTNARFEDVSAKHSFTKPLLITNTKITTDVITYAQCVGMDVLSWDYPEGNNLRDVVEKYNMFPITALTHLPATYKQNLLEQNIVLCNDVCLNPSLINTLSLSSEEKKHILEEAKALCNKTN